MISLKRPCKHMRILFPVARYIQTRSCALTVIAPWKNQTSSTLLGACFQRPTFSQAWMPMLQPCFAQSTVQEGLFNSRVLLLMISILHDFMHQNHMSYRAYYFTYIYIYTYRNAIRFRYIHMYVLHHAVFLSTVPIGA